MTEIKKECILVITADTSCSYRLEQSIICKDKNYNGMYKPPSFISFISSSGKPGEQVLKFALSCSESGIYEPGFVRILFDNCINALLEIKVDNDTVFSEKFSSCGIVINKIENSEYLGLSYLIAADTQKENADDTSEKEKTEELKQQKKELAYKAQKNKEELESLACEISALRVNNSEILRQTDELRLEADKYKNDLDEYEKIRNLKETLEKNAADSQINENEVKMISTQLRYLSQVLEYYKKDNRYITVNEKLAYIREETVMIQGHIAQMCDDRARRLQGISEKTEI